MIGWSRRNRESSERRALWFASLSSEEQRLETAYQEMVTRRWFAWLPFTVIKGAFFLWLVQDTFVFRSPLVIGVFGYMIAGPFLFIPKKSTWKSDAGNSG